MNSITMTWKKKPDVSGYYWTGNKSSGIHIAYVDLDVPHESLEVNFLTGFMTHSISELCRKRYKWHGPIEEPEAPND